jgi:hypothetical protein
MKNKTLTMAIICIGSVLGALPMLGGTYNALETCSQGEVAYNTVGKICGQEGSGYICTQAVQGQDPVTVTNTSTGTGHYSPAAKCAICEDPVDGTHHGTCGDYLQGPGNE